MMPEEMKMDEQDRQRSIKTQKIRCQGVANRLGLLIGSNKWSVHPNPGSIMEAMGILPEQMAEKTFPRISLASLWRRYRQIQLLTFQQAIAIVLDSKSNEEAYKRLVSSAQELGNVHKLSMQKEVVRSRERRLNQVAADAKASVADAETKEAERQVAEAAESKKVAEALEAARLHGLPEPPDGENPEDFYTHLYGASGF